MPNLPQPAAAPRLILLHGLASTPKEFGMMVHPLRRLGVKLVAPEVKSYSDGSLTDAPRWQDWVDSATECVQTLVGSSPEPYVLGGLCTGAMLALAVAARPLPGLHGLALLSPLFSYDGWALPWWYRMRRLAYLLHLDRHFAMRERAPYGLKNERMRQLVRSQMQTEQATLVGPAQVALRVVRESERLSRHVISVLPRQTLPILAVHAREDEICSLKSVQTVLGRVAPSQIRLSVLENSYHMITADNDRQQVADELANFMARVGAAPTIRNTDGTESGKISPILRS
jgi:carboxylesterase